MRSRHRPEFIHESGIIWQTAWQRNVRIVNRDELRLLQIKRACIVQARFIVLASV